MLRPLNLFLKTEQPSRTQTANALRLAFVLSYAFHAAMALITGLPLLLFADIERGTSVLLERVLLVLAPLQLPLALVIAPLLARVGNKQAILSAAMFSAVLLAMPVWLALFALMIGASQSIILVMLGVALLYYAVGFFVAGGYASLLKEDGDS